METCVIFGCDVNIWQILSEDEIGCIASKSSSLSWLMLGMVCRAFVDYARYKQKPYRYLHLNITEKAAKAGYASVMNLGLELGHPYSKKTVKNAILSGNIDCFHNIPSAAFTYSASRALEATATIGSVELFDIILSKITDYQRINYKSDKLYIAAARNNHVHVLNRLWIVDPQLIYPKNIAKIAAKSGSEDALYWALNKGVTITSEIYFYIANTFPYADVMRVLLTVYNHEMGNECPCLPDTATLAVAIARDHHELLEWIAAVCPLKLLSSAAIVAAKYGWIDILRKCEHITPGAFCIAVKKDQFNIVKYLVEKGFIVYANYVEIAIIYNAIRVLDYFAKMPDIFDPAKACNQAHLYGRIRVLKYLHRNGYDLRCSQYGFPSGKILIWLIKNNIIDKTVALLFAANTNNLKIAVWLEPNPAKWSEKVYDTIILQRRYLMHEYAENNNCVENLDAARYRCSN